MAPTTAVTFTGLRFENPFLLSSAPPTESESNIMRAFDAGWGGVVTKTIGLHPVVNVAGPKTKFMRATPETGQLSMQKRPGTALHSSWNWELISDKPIDWWVPRIARIKQAHPNRILVASIMAGSGNDEELSHWQTLAKACQDEGADALELNLSCPHMDRPDMGSNVGKDKELVSIVILHQRHGAIDRGTRHEDHSDPVVDHPLRHVDRRRAVSSLELVDRDQAALQLIETRASRAV